jgi:sortase A
MPRIRANDTGTTVVSPKLALRWTLFVLAIGFLSRVAIMLFQQELHPLQAAEVLDNVRFAAASMPPAVSAEANPQVPLAKLDIPRLSISGYVEEGLDVRTLSVAIGHAPHSAKPGKPGNVILAAHRDTLFAGLRDVRTGDVVHLRSADGKTTLYQVSNVLIVDPADAAVMRETPGQDLLNLITCYPFHFVGPAPQRLVVQAKPLLVRMS